MNKYIKFSSPLIFLLSLILILAFKTVPSGKLWKNYSIISVPVNTPDATVMSAIQSSGIKNCVSLSGQYLPISLSENSIEISMLRLNYGSNEYAYINKRNAMFFDKSNAYRLYYIPAIYSSETTALVNTLSKQGIECIKDSSADYPWIIPLIVCILAGVLLLFVKHKISFASGVIIPLIYLYCNPFYPVATAICLILLCLFFISNIWRRKNALVYLLSKHSIPAMLGIALICAFSCSFAIGGLFILAALGTASALLICYIAEEFFRNKKPFVPVYIRSAKRISLFSGKAVFIMSIVSGFTLLLLLLVFLTSSASFNRSSSKILYPSKSIISDNSLPELEDYYVWNWRVLTSPYRSLNSSEEDNSTISFSTFIENSETGIISEQKTLMTYDDSFRNNTYEGIDNLNFDSIEKVMKSEGKDFSGGYNSVSSYQINIFGIIMCFICLFILLFIYFSIIIRKRY